MARWDLTDDEVEAVLTGAAVDGVAPGLTDLVRQLRHAPAAAAPVPPSAALAEFVSVAELSPVLDLTPIPEETSIMTKLTRRLATTTGRAVVITAVVLGGTSLFGGRGVVLGTLIGAVVVGVLRNGLTLMGVSSVYQVLITGILVILAVTVDQLSRKGGR